MADENLASREHLLDLLVSQLTDYVVLLLDTEGNLRSWHPAVKTLLGYEREEFVGRCADILFPLPDRLQGRLRRELQTAAETGRAPDTNWMITRQGRPVFVEGICLPLRDTATGELLGFGKMFHDVTQRKQTEDDRKTLMRTLEQSVIYVVDWDGLIEHWTYGCERVYGWSAQEMLGKPADELLETVYPVSLQVIRGQLIKSETWQGELQQKRKDGTTVNVAAYWVLFKDGDGTPPTIIATHTDITSLVSMQRERETTTAQLRSMALELERSNAELEEFARIASHDLSAPITSTRWLVELLASRHAATLDADGKKILQQISVGLERMMDLVEAILAHALVGKERIGASEAVSADRALDIALENLRRDINQSEAEIERGPLPELFIEVQPLARLFQNLISNAIKYRREGVRPEIAIDAQRNGNMWIVSVRDNGMGIEPEWQERIFHPMQRRHSAKIAGSGIGLATCRKIVTRAGGKIWVESQVGQGSTFHFSLPGSETPHS
ncbi:MAG TPA: PAS domain S-box protein [Bryobacteraceae bacterium]|jgi:PAS domain S-box-containing protein|nr:PAS domain S-box protein [Bryobacteraceae bacterium]